MAEKVHKPKPFEGKRMVTTRPGKQSAVFASELRELGAEVIELPSIRIKPPVSFTELDAAIKQIDTYDWIIFTSVNGVKFFSERMLHLSIKPQRLNYFKIGAIGPATAAAIQDLGVNVDFMPSSYVAESIADEIRNIEGDNILLPRADIARKNLANLLRNKGARVTDIDAYQTVQAEFDAATVKKNFTKPVDIITFTSSSTVRYFKKIVDELELDISGAKIACIGPVTANTTTELGLVNWVVAPQHTVEGLIDAMMAKLQEEKSASI